jgi:hypothetical protein
MQRGDSGNAEEAWVLEARPMRLDDDILASYLRRSYQAVDGLWFMMVEEDLGFELALDLDVRVWRVLAKIQAREARELLRVSGNSAEELARCFSVKLEADGHQFSVETSEDDVVFCIQACPWLELVRKSDRQHIAAKVAQAVCPAEGSVWCTEFGGEWHFDMPLMACSGAEGCEMRFSRAVE